MNKNLTVALAIGGGIVGLVVLHSLLAGQSAAQTAVSMGATLTAPFNVSTADGTPANGGLANGVTVTSSSAGPAGQTQDGTGVAFHQAPTAPPGIDPTGWGAALGGMGALAAGVPPWADPAVNPNAANVALGGH